MPRRDSSYKNPYKGLYTQYCDIVIKRYYDIWQFLATDFYWPNTVNVAYLGLSFVKSLPLLVIETHGSKLSISIYIFIAILWAKISSVYKL